MAQTIEELQVFQRARVAADELFALIRATELGKDYDLARQLNRGSIRVVSDIAEGFEQKTDAHFAKFLYDAKGSSAEIRAQLALAAGRAYITERDHQRVSRLYEEIGRMLSGLIAHLERESRQNRRAGWKKMRGHKS